jgi:hypothetical protein
MAEAAWAAIAAGSNTRIANEASRTMTAVRVRAEATPRTMDPWGSARSVLTAAFVGNSKVTTVRSIRSMANTLPHCYRHPGERG